MPTPAQIRELIRKPAAMARYNITGRLPQEHVPSSPLITLLESLGPRDLQAIMGLIIDHRLGYSGSRQFPWASQALRWLKPGGTFSRPASESWQDKRFSHRLYLEDLQDCCRDLPDILLERRRDICRPTLPSASRSLRP